MSREPPLSAEESKAFAAHMDLLHSLCTPEQKKKLHLKPATCQQDHDDVKALVQGLCKEHGIGPIPGLAQRERMFSLGQEPEVSTPQNSPPPPPVGPPSTAANEPPAKRQRLGPANDEAGLAQRGSAPVQPVSGIVQGKRKARKSLGQPQKRRRQTAKSAKSAPERKTCADFPRVVQLWHPTKNGDKLPKDYSHGSRKQVWLQCHGCPDCGQEHEWQASPDHLTFAGRAGKNVCPACAGKGSFCSCHTISGHDLLAAEWHEDNPPPETVSQTCHKKYWWRCSNAVCGHVWESQAYQRFKKGGSRCPECGEGVHKKHPSLAEGRPDLLLEWDEDKNRILPTEVTCGSGQRVWWLCAVCKGSWETTVNQRGVRGSGCPVCRRTKFKSTPAI